VQSRTFYSRHSVQVHCDDSDDDDDDDDDLSIGPVVEIFLQQPYVQVTTRSTVDYASVTTRGLRVYPYPRVYP